MKLALLLPGYLDSPDYLHFQVFEKRLQTLGYFVEKIDPCDLWKTGDTSNYNVTNYLKQIDKTVFLYKGKNLQDLVLIGHSLGGAVAVISGNRIPEVTKIVAICTPANLGNGAEKWEHEGQRLSIRDLPNNNGKSREFRVPISFLEDAQQYSVLENARIFSKPLMIFIALDDTSVPHKSTEQIVKNAHDPYVVRQQNINHHYRGSEKDCNVVMDAIEGFLKSS